MVPLSLGKTEIATESALGHQLGRKQPGYIRKLKASDKRHRHPGEAGSDGALGKGKSQVLGSSPAGLSLRQDGAPWGQEECI